MIDPELLSETGKGAGRNDKHSMTSPKVDRQGLLGQVRKLDYSKDPAFFFHMADGWDVEKFQALWTVGSAELLKCELLALFCSRKCPGSIVRKSHDFATELRRNGTPVIGGFQTPVEKMCLEVFLKGEQPVVVCPARGIQNIRLEPEWRKPVGEGRLLLVSPFSARQRRPNKNSAELRNRLVAAAADRLFFFHAASDSKTFAFAEELLSGGRDLVTFDVKENENLKKLGAAGWREKW